MKKYQYIVAAVCILMGAVGFAGIYATNQLQKNKDKIVSEYIPTVKEIIIPIPQRKIKTRKMFTFLDEENECGK